MDLLPAAMRQTGNADFDGSAGCGGMPLEQEERRICLRFHYCDDAVIRIILMA